MGETVREGKEGERKKRQSEKPGWKTKLRNLWKEPRS